MMFIEIHNNVIPFKGYKCITLFPFLFIRKDVKPMSEVDYRHEDIHAIQQLEMLLVFFYLWYGIEYLIRFFSDSRYPYRDISLEREAYENEDDEDYIRERKLYSWTKYL